MVWYTACYGMVQYGIVWCGCCSVTQSCLTLCDPVDCSTHGLLALQLPEFAKTDVHWIDDAIHPSHPLPRLSCPTSSPALNLSQHQGFFPVSQLFASSGQSIGTSASESVLPINIQGWFPLGLTGLISLQCKGLSSVFSSTTVQKNQFFSAYPLWSDSHICTKP